jgi:hypothetical protein
LITAIGLPRSVKITSLPAFTALIRPGKALISLSQSHSHFELRICSDVTTIDVYEAVVKQLVNVEVSRVRQVRHGLPLPGLPLLSISALLRIYEESALAGQNSNLVPRSTVV